MSDFDHDHDHHHHDRDCTPPAQAAPVVTTEQSPALLKPTGYSMDDLIHYIQRSLGQGVLEVEISTQQCADAVQDALILYGIWRPVVGIRTVRMVRNKYAYLQGEDVGQGLVRVDFVEPLPAPTAMFYGNLLDAAPLMKTGLDDYDTFLRWRKTWMRVTSVMPDWYYDDYEKVLFIHNPIERYNCTAFYYRGIDKCERLDFYGADWVKKYALAKAKYVLGELYAKFSGAIPNPTGNLTLDQGKKTEAQTEIDKLVETLKLAQRSSELQMD